MRFQTVLLRERKIAYTKEISRIEELIRNEHSNKSFLNGSDMQFINSKAELAKAGYSSLKQIIRDKNKGVVSINTVNINNIILIDELVNKFLYYYALENTLDSNPCFRIKLEDIITPEKALKNIEKLLFDTILKTLKHKDNDEQLREISEAEDLFQEIFNGYNYEFAYKEDKKCLIIVALNSEQFVELNKLHKLTGREIKKDILKKG